MSPVALTLWCICHCCSVTKSCLTLCDPMDCSKPGFPVPYHHPEFVHFHIYWISDAIQPSHPLLPSSPCAFNLSQLQGLFQSISCSHQVAKLVELLLGHLFFPQLFVKPLQTTIWPSCISFPFGIVLVTASYTMLQTSMHSSSDTLSTRSNPVCYFHCIIIRGLIWVIPEWPSSFPYFLQFKPEFCNKELMI